MSRWPHAMILCIDATGYIRTNQNYNSGGGGGWGMTRWPQTMILCIDATGYIRTNQNYKSGGGGHDPMAAEHDTVH